MDGTQDNDFLLAYTQAVMERDLYMKIPAGFVVSGRVMTEDERKLHVLKLEKNWYGQKQAGRVWYLHLKKNLEKIGFKGSKHDECLFYYGKTIFIVYTDDTILMGPDKERNRKTSKENREHIQNRGPRKPLRLPGDEGNKE
jgi:hypothetical protein